jgi:hypothetical protein
MAMTILGISTTASRVQAKHGFGAFAGGTTMTISWAASDDEAVRGFDVQATYDGGRTWHFLAKGLPAAATSYGWQLPPLDEALTVRVRVVAWDLRFQSAAATSGAISIVPGTDSPADVDGDGFVDFADLLALLSSWGDCPAPPAECPTDVDGDGAVGFGDLLIVLADWTA